MMAKLIEPYNPNWKIEFEHIKLVIEKELGDLALHTDIQHIGSTSVPGLFAKPILDIDIIIGNNQLLQPIQSTFERIGYQYKGEQGIAGRFAFRQTSAFVPLTPPNKKWLSHHLYVCFSDSLALKNHLLFRDMLRNDRDLVVRYSALKKSLTEGLQITREAYTIQKTNFIIAVLAQDGLSETELQQIADANA